MKKANIKTTRKKVKIVGKESYINQKTGELVEMNVIEEQERDANFHKLWLGHIIQSLELVGNKKLKVVTYIMENLNSENIFLMTQRELGESVGVSYRVVTQTIKALKESNFLKQVRSGAYQVNPNVLFKGSKSKRMDILIRYKRLDELEGQVHIDEIEE